MRVKHLLIVLCVWGVIFPLNAGNGQSRLYPSGDCRPSLRTQFSSLSENSKPWTFWYWMYGAVTPEAITADLEAMHRIGLGGAYLMPIRGVERAPEFGGKAPQLSPEWWKMVGHSMKEADRLGLKLGMHICDGFALAGGPWITPAESMQKVVWADTIVSGGKLKHLRLPRPESYKGYYEDIAVFAVPLRRQPKDINYKPVITLGSLEWTAVPQAKSGELTVNNKQSADQKNYNPEKAVRQDEEGVIRSSYPCWIQYTYPVPVTCRSIEVISSGNNYQANRLKVLASDDGTHFRVVKQLVPARHGWQNTDQNSTSSIPETTARFFRFEWTPEGSEPGSEDLDAAKWKPDLKINAILLHTSPRINQWEGKAGLVWRVAPATTNREVPDDECIKTDEMIRLPLAQTSGGDVIDVQLPSGQWRILRMGHTSIGHINATGGDGKGLECDKFSAVAVKKQFDNWFGQIFLHTDKQLAHRVVKYMHVDSWECGSQNWSTGFSAEFKKRRGYDLMPYLPLLAGVPMESAARSEQILRDVRTTIAELVVDVFYQVMDECAKAYDCQFSAESVAPTMVSDGMLHYSKADLPMGEFWLNSPTHDKPNDVLDAISGAHVYGKNIVQAEGLTEVRGVWDEDPAMLKPVLDRNFALGVNKLFFHVFVHNPWMDKKPGMTLDGIGAFFQRDQTWWNEGKAFVDYINRCQTMLQYGHPVVDIAVFTGEEIPRRAFLPERLVPMLPGIYGKARVKAEEKRLENKGQPLAMRPVGVTYAANTTDPEHWVNPMRGYAYDSFNKDALLRLAQMKDGRMVLPGGVSYKVLVLPGAHPMNPDNIPLSTEVSQKIEEYRRKGLIIPQLPYQAGDFNSYGLERDVVVPENVAWNHRSGEEMEVYFIANQDGAVPASTDSLSGGKEGKRTFTASFRISGRQPELWDPMTGKICRPANWVEKNGRTEVELALDHYGSVFVVFPKEASSELSSEFTETAVLPCPVKEWNVRFSETGKTVVRTTLFDWSREADEKIKYYSGKALYSDTFRWKESGQKAKRVVVRLGKVANVATVRVNGVACGTAWTAPYEVDVTDALRKGTNTLDIEVVNTWANALRGADLGKAPFDGIWTNAKYRLPGDNLLPAGLLGPVEFVLRSSKINLKK